jgi:hypothetical protein
MKSMMKMNWAVNLLAPSSSIHINITLYKSFLGTMTAIGGHVILTRDCEKIRGKLCYT